MINKILAISESLGLWATSSMHAMLITGALGSILGIILWKLSSPVLMWILNKILDFILKFAGGVGNLAVYFKAQTVQGKELYHQLRSQDDNSLLLMYFIFRMLRSFFVVWFNLFYVIGLIIFLNLHGLEYPKLSIFLIGFEGFLFIGMITNLAWGDSLEKELRLEIKTNFKSEIMRNYFDDENKFDKIKFLNDFPINANLGPDGMEKFKKSLILIDKIKGESSKRRNSKEARPPK